MKGAGLGVVALVGVLALSGCALWEREPPRVAPVGTVAPHPEEPGVYVLNPALPQPDPAGYRAGGASGGLGGLLGFLADLLPGPWGPLLAGLIGMLVGLPAGRRGPLRALRQTVNGIELAKHEAPEALPALHAALDRAQDESAKRLVWELRP
jgi:hypothetical protein